MCAAPPYYSKGRGAPPFPSLPPLPIIAKAELSYAHKLSRRRVPRFRLLNKQSRSHSTTLKPSSFKISLRYLLNAVNRLSKFKF